MKRLLGIEDLSKLDKDEIPEHRMLVGSLFDSYMCWAADDGASRAAGVHASEISKCPRSAVYTMLGTPRTDPPALFWRRKFDHGKWVHSGIQQRFHELADASGGMFEFQDEVRIHPGILGIASDFNVHSSCDGVFTIMEKDEHGNLSQISKIGLEIKTASPAEFEKLQAPKAEHIEQVHLYMACLNIPIFWILYYNKGNENMTPANGPFIVTFNSSIWEKISDRINSWMDLIEEGKLPERQEGFCDMCPYATTCQPPGGIPRRGGKKTAPPDHTVSAVTRYGRKK